MRRRRAKVMAQGKVDSLGEAKVFPGIENYYIKIDHGAKPGNRLPEVCRRALRSGIIHEVNRCQALADKRSQAGLGLIGGAVIQNNCTNPMVHFGKLIPMIPANSKLDTGNGAINRRI